MDDELSLDTYRLFNLTPESTGLPFVVFVTQDTGSNEPYIVLSHTPRIQDLFVHFTINAPVRASSGVLFGPVVNQIEAWIEKNREVLLGYWDGTIPFSSDAMERLSK